VTVPVTDPIEFVALTTNEYDPTVVGVPVIEPSGLSVKPGGSVPLTSAQVIGIVPVACNADAYATPV
jgi:hypothetical protein